MCVFAETLPLIFAPRCSSNSVRARRSNDASVPVNTIVLPRNGSESSAAAEPAEIKRYSLLFISTPHSVSRRKVSRITGSEKSRASAAAVISPISSSASKSCVVAAISASESGYLRASVFDALVPRCRMPSDASTRANPRPRASLALAIIASTVFSPMRR